MASDDHGIGGRLRRYRLAAGLSMSDVARRSGVSRSYIHQIESGTSAPTVDKAARLADALGVPLADVLADEHAPPAMPLALAHFVSDAQLPPADVAMLSRISYRGRQPASAEAWRVLYTVIQALCNEGASRQEDTREPHDPAPNA